MLRSRIAYSSVKTDQVVQKYSDEAGKNAPDEAHLIRSKADYQQMLVLGLLDFGRLRRYFAQPEPPVSGNTKIRSTPKPGSKSGPWKPRLRSRFLRLPKNLSPTSGKYFAQSGLAGRPPGTASQPPGKQVFCRETGQRPATSTPPGTSTF